MKFSIPVLTNLSMDHRKNHSLTEPSRLNKGCKDPISFHLIKCQLSKNVKYRIFIFSKMVPKKPHLVCTKFSIFTKPYYTKFTLVFIKLRNITDFSDGSCVQRIFKLYFKRCCLPLTVLTRRSFQKAQRMSLKDM